MYYMHVTSFWKNVTSRQERDVERTTVHHVPGCGKQFIGEKQITKNLQHCIMHKANFERRNRSFIYMIVL
jgi:hypothetical protein